VGFLADARAHYHASGSGHRVAGALAGGQALSRFRPLAVHVGGAVGRGEELALSQLFVANLPLFEFGLHVAPHADPRDGMLDFVGFEGRTRRDVLAMMHHLHAGDHLGREGVHIWRAESGRIRPHGLSPVIADSTNLGSGPVDLEVVRGALRLVRPG
jgi:diacylglycerol kinase family enzyme